MTTQQSFEFRECFFINEAFKHIQTFYPSKSQNETERLSFACKLIHAARDKYKQAISQGKLEMDAMNEAGTIFATKSIEP